MKIYVFLYNDFSDFEIVQALLLLKESKLITVGFEKGLIKSIGQLKVEVELSIDDLKTNNIDLFLIPGGEPKNFIRDNKYSKKLKILNEKMRELHNNNKIIAAICGGPTFLAYAGLLKNKKCTASISDDEKEYYEDSIFTNEDLEFDKQILTAKGNAFTEFAIELASIFNILKSEEEKIEAINWFRNKK